MKGAKKRCSTAILLMVSTWQSMANNAYVEVDRDNLCEFGTGWANYCDPTVVVEAPPKKKTSPKVVVIQSAQPKEKPEDPNDPLVWLKNYQEGEKRARAKMVMTPTEENVKAYRREYFNDTIDRSTLVSDLWRRSAWQNPEFDYTLKRPTGYLSKREHDLRRTERVDNSVGNLAERYGIFFVFKSNDANSAKFAPIIKDFSDKHKLTVQGVSIDGKALSTWQGKWRKGTSDALERLGLNSDYSPAVILFDRQEQKAVPIGFGILAHDELANRLYVLTQLKVGEDY